jgi:hypothetical protein
MILESVTSAIQIELEDGALIEDTLAALTHLIATYGVSDERAREYLLEQVNNLKLGDSSSMTDYINKHRECKLDHLVRSRMDTCLLAPFLSFRRTHNPELIT